MILETVILLYFQTKSGILYQDLGILLTGFMAGLSFGAFAVEKIQSRPGTLGRLFYGHYSLLSQAA